jgi:hypothetical protein
MEFHLAERLIEEAADLGVFSSIGFTGGEPLLFEAEIIALSELLRSKGLSFTIATAAHWADDRCHASELLTQLAANGLTRINISYDPSHSKFVSRNSVLNAAGCSVDLGIETHVVGTFYSPDLSLESALPELVGIANLQSKLVAKVGRASRKPIDRHRYRLEVEALDQLACYRHIYHDVVVFWDGNVYPCCSTFNRDTPGLVIGNVREESLRTIWARLNGSEMFRVMKRKGFGEFYRIVTRIDPELIELLPTPSAVLGPCSLCNQIFKDESIARRISRIFATAEVELVREVVGRLSELLDERELDSMISQAINKSKEAQDGRQFT